MTPPPAAAVAETLPRTRRPSRRTPAPRPRRVSGPAAPARRSAPARRTGAAPKRASGRAAARPANSPGLALRTFAVYERVADSQLLDRLARGRLWIGLLAFALIGIVAMQLMVLKLNTGIGATLTREAALQRDNVQLGIQSSTGSGEARIEPLAAATGMTFAPPGSVHFVTSNPATDVSRAAQALAAPIQPHEASASSYESGGGEASGGSSEATSSEAGTGEATASGGEAEAAGTSGSAGSAGATEASSGQSAGSTVTSDGSSEASAGSSAPTATEASAQDAGGSAAAAGGVAAGHE